MSQGVTSVRSRCPVRPNVPFDRSQRVSACARRRGACRSGAREGPRWFRPGHGGFIPLEFAGAAYRYGHSQIRHRYRLNSQSDPVPIFPDLLGLRALPRERAIDWTLFFDAPGAAPAQRSKKIDGKLVRSLIELPVDITGECEIDAYIPSPSGICNAGMVSGYRLVRRWPVISESTR